MSRDELKKLIRKAGWGGIQFGSSVDGEIEADEILLLVSWIEIERFAELAADRDCKDAARYRWLRDIGDETWRPFCERTGYSSQQCDEAIDAAIRARGEKKV